MNWSRRQFLANGGLAAMAAGRRFNVLLFMSDQESALLPGPVRLPNRRKLEEGGVRFSQAFCNTPQCSAARSALLTGLEPNQTGVWTNVDAGSIGKPLEPSIPTVGSVFQAAGYNTGYFGKWHLGNDADGLAKFGFETTGPSVDDDLIARRAAAWIRAQRRPWLAWVSVLNPHHIYEAPALLKRIRPRPGVRPPFTTLENLTGKPPEQRQYVDKDQGRLTRDFTPQDWIRYRSYYLELVEKADEALGTVLGAVSDLNSTIVVYTSDHGDALGEHGLPFKGPFMYEELIRIPFLIRAPGLPLRRSAGYEMIRQSDLAPTLTALCGLKGPGRVAGTDVSGGHLSRDAVFLEYYAKQKWVNPIRTVRTRRWKLNWYDSGHRELYDLERDPHETRNLAGEAGSSVVEKKLEERISAWRGPAAPSSTPEVFRHGRSDP